MSSLASPLGQPLPPPPAGPLIATERPGTPFTLSILGGGFIAIVGGIEVYYGIVAPGPFGSGGLNNLPFGALGFGLGILIIILGSLLLARPELHMNIGIAITVLSVLSVIWNYGGFVVGLVLGVLGGVSAIAWRPRPSTHLWPGGVWQVPAHRVCLHCGRFLTFDMRFCPYCSTPVG